MMLRCSRLIRQCRPTISRMSADPFISRLAAYRILRSQLADRIVAAQIIADHFDPLIHHTGLFPCHPKLVTHVPRTFCHLSARNIPRWLQPRWGCFRFASFTQRSPEDFRGNVELEANAPLGHPEWRYATIPFRRLHSSGFLHQGPPAAPARQIRARRAPLVPRRRLQTTRLPAHPRRRRGRPRASARAIRTHPHAGRMGEGIETRLQSLAEGTRSRLRRLRVATRLRGFLREPIESRIGKAIHRRAGRASSQNWLPGRVARVAAKARDRMGREIRLGLNQPQRAATKENFSAKQY